MQWISLDLGSTNLKGVVYNNEMKCLAEKSMAVVYNRKLDFVEFDADEYCQSVLNVIIDLVSNSAVDAESIKQVVFTGQAESLVLLDKNRKPIMPIISWMDERSKEQCEQLKEMFDLKEVEQVTGQLTLIPTWPATKILWLKQNKPELFLNVDKFVLLKDYLVYYLSGVLQADCSIATFSCYFDIYNRCYWDKMLEAIGITKNQLPKLVEPCTVAGSITKEISQLSGLPPTTKVNHGILDHFSGMIGCGNVRGDMLSMSTGTVLALATTAANIKEKNSGIPMHYGFSPNNCIALPVVESGGAALEWFKTSCIKDMSFKEIDTEVQKLNLPSDVYCLPYIVGTSAPEFNAKMKCLFYGMRSEHGAIDMAAAVMEGVSFILKKNCDLLAKKGLKINGIIATGGGAKSAVWCQMQADITGLPIILPKEKESACYGAGIIASVSEQLFDNFTQACDAFVSEEKRYLPRQNSNYEKKYKKFCQLYTMIEEFEG